MKVKNFFPSFLDKMDVVNIVRNLKFKDDYIKLYSDNYISNNSPIFNLVINHHAMDFGFYINSFLELGSFRIVSMGDEKTSYSNDNDYKLPFQEYTHLRFSYVIVEDKYRKNSIMSYSLCKVLLSILKMHPDKNFIIDLKNTSNVIDDPFKIYDSILTDRISNFQYRLFGINNRKSDILELQEKITRYKTRFTSNLCGGLVK